jgi:hypothetical protein
MQSFTVDLRSAQNAVAVVASFNAGLIGPSGGEWKGNSWDAFHDYLSWPEAERYELKILGWTQCPGLSMQDREMMQTIFTDNPHVQVSFV